MEDIRKRLSLNLKVYTPNVTRAMYESFYGNPFEMGDNDFKEFKHKFKVEPLERALKELGVSGVLTSIHGPDAISQDAITQRPRTFIKTIRGIKLLQEYKN